MFIAVVSKSRQPLFRRWRLPNASSTKSLPMHQTANDSNGGCFGKRHNNWHFWRCLVALAHHFTTVLARRGIVLYLSKYVTWWLILVIRPVTECLGISQISPTLSHIAYIRIPLQQLVCNPEVSDFERGSRSVQENTSCNNRLSTSSKQNKILKTGHKRLCSRRNTLEACFRLLCAAFFCWSCSRPKRARRRYRISSVFEKLNLTRFSSVLFVCIIQRINFIQTWHNWTFVCFVIAFGYVESPTPNSSSTSTATVNNVRYFEFRWCSVATLKLNSFGKFWIQHCTRCRFQRTEASAKKYWQGVFCYVFCFCAKRGRFKLSQQLSRDFRAETLCDTTFEKKTQWYQVACGRITATLRALLLFQFRRRNVRQQTTNLLFRLVVDQDNSVGCDCRLLKQFG